MTDLTDDIALPVLVVMCVLTVPAHIYRWIRFRGFLHEVRQLSRTIKTLRQEAAELNCAETFVRYAKMNRVICKKEEKIQELGTEMKAIYRSPSMTRWLFFAKVIIGMILLYVYGNVEIVQLGFPVEGNAEHLIDRAVEEKRCAIGEVRLLVWLFLTNAACNACIDSLMPFDYGELTTSV